MRIYVRQYDYAGTGLAQRQDDGREGFEPGLARVLFCDTDDLLQVSYKNGDLESSLSSLV